MNKGKLIWWGSNAVLFLMYWAMFTAIWNWWIALNLAATITGIQIYIQYELDKGKIIK